MPATTRIPTRAIVLLVVAVVVFVGSAVRFVHLTAGGDAPDTVTSTPATDTNAGVAGAGPALGDDVDAYLRSRRDALAALPVDRTTTAVVSFTSYRTVADAVAVLPSTLTLLAVQYRLPVPGEQPTMLPAGRDDVTATVEKALADARTAVADERDAVAGLLASGTIDDPDWKAEHEQRLADLTDLQSTLGDAPAVVFAAVVEGPAARLQALAEHDGVRLVDPVATSSAVEPTMLYGVLPDDRDAVSAGRAP